MTCGDILTCQIFRRRRLSQPQCKLTRSFGFRRPDLIGLSRFQPGRQAFAVLQPGAGSFCPKRIADLEFEAGDLLRVREVEPVHAVQSGCEPIRDLLVGKLHPVADHIVIRDVIGGLLVPNCQNIAALPPDRFNFNGISPAFFKPAGRGVARGRAGLLCGTAPSGAASAFGCPAALIAAF